MARSATARRLAVVVVATAFVSVAGPAIGSASAATSLPEPGPAATGGLLGGLTDTLNITLNSLLNGIPASSPEAKAPALGKTVDSLTKTVKELPLVGPPVGSLTDGLGLSEAQDTEKPAPAAPQTVTPAAKPGKDKGRTDRVAQMPPAGSTWTAPMMAQLPAGAARFEEKTSAPKGGAVSRIAHDVASLFPQNASEAAAAGAGAATIALIVLGGIAVTGAAGAASAAGRRGLVSGSMGGSL